MKIEKSCSPTSPNVKMVFRDIPNGAVFRHNIHIHGPYLKLAGGIVNLEANLYHPLDSENVFTNYLAFPNARVVTGE